MSDWVTPQNVIDFLGLPSTYTAVAQRWGRAAQYLIDKQIGGLEAAYYDETHSHSGINSLLFLNHTPVISLVAVTVQQGLASTATAYDVTDFRIDNNTGQIIYVPRAFPRGKKHISVFYQAGYSTIPDEIKTAVYLTASALYNRRQALGLETVRLTDMSIRLARRAIPDEAMRIIDQYRHPVA